MQWENLSTPQFVKAVELCANVCLLPLGVIEKHGDHLPLGTDVYLAREIALRAARIEPVLVFPPYFFTQIFEARHTPGTVGINSRVMYDLLETTCDEIARNGLKKIILVNGHGGNRYFLQHFIMLQLERPRDYVVYLPRPDAWNRDEEFARGWEELRESQIRDEHAGEAETSMMLATAPDLVDISMLPTDQGVAQDRLSHLEKRDLYTAIGWYADFPHHYSGRGEYGTAAKGEFILNHLAKRLVEIIRVVKDDTVTPALQQEFFERVF
ncbi:MAG: creatinine amidohydrolase [Chloroflexota bacterium]|nr:MAG: creatinine amidohydrolase [Chloroflexota bacterium]